jgi:uncharacterized repeat protein (TIGR03837 family)
LTHAPIRCDIFCRVIDNYGDIGVCWRLSRQLVLEHALRVRLIVDDLASFQRIAPDLLTIIDRQQLKGVEVLRWRDAPPGDPADLVIEAFACHLPTDYEARMAARGRPPVWINLEYLSAESWVEDHHLKASPHPRLPITKYFFLPGFSAGSGGLLREHELPIGRESTAPPQSTAAPLRVFLFGYDGAPAEALAIGAQRAGKAMQVSVVSERLGDKLKRWGGLQAKNELEAAPMLELRQFIFVPQEAFDKALRAHDILFVRGEDSFVRAQWAGKPFIWQIYPQADGAHWHKLDAFLDRYCVGLSLPAAGAVRRLWHAWNCGDIPAAALAWTDFVQQRGALEAHACDWARCLASNPDLASNLLSFYRKIAKI